MYENYLSSISSVPGFKNRSTGVRAVLTFGQAQNSFSYPTQYEKIPPILRSENSKEDLPKSVKMKKGIAYRKKAPIIIQKRDISKYFTPQKDSSKI